MVSLGDRALSKDARRHGRETVYSPYTRLAKLSDPTSNSALQSVQQQQRKKSKSAWGLSSLWKWISSYPEDESEEKSGDELADDSRQEDNQTRDNAEPAYVASPAALRLRQRGNEILETHVLPGGLPLSPPPTSSDMRQLAPRQVQTPDDTPSIDATRGWLQGKIRRGEPIQADEALNILGLLNELQTGPKQSSLQYQLANPRYTLASSGGSSAGSSAANTPIKTLKSNPNGDIFYRGVTSNGNLPRFRSSPALSSPSRDPFTSSSASKAGVEKSIETSGALHSSQISTSSVSSVGLEHNTPAVSRPAAPPSTTPGLKARPSSSFSMQGSTSTEPSTAPRGFSSVPSNPPPRSKYSATVEDASDDEDNAPPKTSLLSTMPPVPPQSKTQAPPPSEQPSIFTNQSTSKDAGSPNTQLRSKYGPRHPSPLRQSTRPESPTSSPPQQRTACENMSSSTSTPMAYNIMRDIIKEASASTPKPATPKFNVSNPYQRDGHVRKVSLRKVPAPKLQSKPKAEPPKPVAQEKPKTSGNSFLDFLGNSGPKSTKRARIEDNIEEGKGEMLEPSPRKAKSSNIIKESTTSKSFFSAKGQLEGNDLVVEDLGDKSETAKGAPASKPSEIVEPTTNQSKPNLKPTYPSFNAMPSMPSSLNKPPGFFPKEPSPLRQSFQASQEESSPERSTESNCPPTSADAPSPLKPLKRKMTREEILEIPDDELPKFDLQFDSTNVPKYNERAKAAALAVPVEKLPVFDLSPFGPDTPIRVHATATTTFTSFASTKSSSKPVEALSGPPKPSGGFNWAAAGVKPPTSNAGTWTCNTCMISNTNDASKCAACESPNPSSKPASVEPPRTGFNWTAAGMNQPSTKSDSWTCETCMIPNSGRASKCAACESPNPAAKPTNTEGTSKTGFNWAMAGIKQPTTNSGSWTCSTCMISNSVDAKKCVACESPAPGPSSSSAKPAPSMPSPPAFPVVQVPRPPSSGFDWAAAGMRPPSSMNGEWKCSTCMIQNPASFTKCTACETPK